MSSFRTPVVVVALLLAAACGGDGGSSPAVTDSTAPGSEPTTTGEVDAPTTTVDAPSTTVAPVDDALPESYYQFGADGLVRFIDGQAERLVATPVAYATSDGVGGVLYSDWSPTELGTRWLPADTDESRFVWDGYRAIPALLDGRSVIVASFATDECFSDVPNMVARDLETGADTTLQCGTGGPDDGWGPNSYGGGLYVGDAWSAVIDQGAMLSSIGLVFRDERGAIIEHPANPYSDDCHPCELTAALSPDGERLAVIYRPDALQFRNENWGAETVDVPAELQVFDLRTGDLVFQHQLSAGAQPRFDWTPWFDGRFVALGPDRFDYPSLYRDSTGDEVRTLQRMLVAAGFDIEVDGIYGPGTRAAVEVFHNDRFGASRPAVWTDTWTELGVPDTIIDTHTGNTVEVPGAVALEVMFADDTPVWSGDDAPDSAILRSNGIGPYTFGHEADEVEQWLDQRLGPPDEQIVETGQLGWPLEACVERRAANWLDTGLTVAYTDHDSSGICTATPRPRRGCSTGMHPGSPNTIQTTPSARLTWSFKASPPAQESDSELPQRRCAPPIPTSSSARGTSTNTARPFSTSSRTTRAASGGTLSLTYNERSTTEAEHSTSTASSVQPPDKPSPSSSSLQGSPRPVLTARRSSASSDPQPSPPYASHHQMTLPWCTCQPATGPGTSSHPSMTGYCHSYRTRQRTSSRLPGVLIGGTR